MWRWLFLYAVCASVIAAGILYLTMGPGTPASGDIHITIKSVAPPDNSRHTFYIISIADRAGNRLLTAERLANEATRLESGKLVNNGHGIWSDLPAHGKQFVLEWRGHLPIKRGDELFVETGKPASQSVLDITIGRHASRVALPGLAWVFSLTKTSYLIATACKVIS